MAIAKLLEAAACCVAPDLASFHREIPVEFIEQALGANGVATMRRRRLPVEQVIWLVLGMALMRDRSIADVARSLDLALPGPAVVGASALCEARGRVGDAPLKWLFRRTAKDWAKQYEGSSQWRDLTLLGIDGTTLGVADTQATRAHFGAQEGPTGSSGYPMLRLTALLQLGTHLIQAARFGPYATSEHALSLQMLDEIPNHSLTVVDRNFHGATLLYRLQRDGVERHWLRRTRKNNVWRVLEPLGKNDDLVEMTVSDRAQRDDSTLPQTWVMRAIRYKRPNGEQDVLLTSMVDPQRYPAREIVDLYRLRWEIELAYDELKCELNVRTQTLRSKTERGIYQEMWGTLIAYNLVRLEMARVAKKAELPPTRLSFLGSLRLIREEWFLDANASPGAIPGHLRRLEQNLLTVILPPRRTSRSFPRVVKVRSRRYPRKRRASAHPTA